MVSFYNLCFSLPRDIYSFSTICLDHLIFRSLFSADEQEKVVLAVLDEEEKQNKTIWETEKVEEQSKNQTTHIIICYIE